MKKALFFSLMAFLALWMPSCKNEDSLESEKTEQMYSTITVNMASLETDGDTKTRLDGLDVKWCDGDEIILISKADFNSTDMKYAKYEIETGQGSQSATFKYKEGEHGTTEGEFYGIYCPAGCSFSGGSLNPKNPQGYMDIVDTQPYVEGNIANGLLTMWGYGKSLGEMQFSHNQSVLVIPLWTEDDKTIDRIEVTSTDGLSGKYYHSFSTNPSSFQFQSYNPQTKLTYTFGDEGLKLSTSSEDPTKAMIVVPGLSLSKLAITVYEKNGSSYAYMCKSSVFKHGPGKVVTFPTTKLTFYAQPNVEIKVGDAEYMPLSEYKDTPIGEILVKADASLTSLQMDQIATIVSKQKKSSSISLDLSQTTLVDNNFSNWFVDCKSLYEIKLPAGLQTTTSGICLPSTITSKIDFPEGMVSINTNFLNGPVCAVGIPSSVNTIKVANAYTITGFDVDSSNDTFASEDGVLFNNAKTKLLYYPGRKEGIKYTIPSSVTTVGDYAFQYNRNLDSLIVHEGVTEMGKGVFSQAKSFKYIELQRGNSGDPALGTNLIGITYADSDPTKFPSQLFPLYGSERKIVVPSGCTYYSVHSVWKLFFDKLYWTLAYN